jgi:hypothetical protein
MRKFNCLFCGWEFTSGDIRSRFCTSDCEASHEIAPSESRRPMIEFKDWGVFLIEGIAVDYAKVKETTEAWAKKGVYLPVYPHPDNQ